MFFKLLEKVLFSIIYVYQIELHNRGSQTNKIHQVTLKQHSFQESFTLTLGNQDFAYIVIFKIYCMMWKIVVLLIIHTYAEEWYIPNSHIINEAQFIELVANDKTTYKLVKFFTPNCVFCRYLKNTIDTLKAQKKWNFQIYDFNCADYPQKCFQLGVTAYPFVIVYNQNGDKEENLLGNYPLPILQQFFDKIEQKNGLSPQQQEQNPTKSQKMEKDEPQQIIESKEVNIDEIKQQIVLPDDIEQAIKPNPNDYIQTFIKNVDIQSVLPKQEVSVQPIHLQGYSQDIFFCICILLGVAYFCKISQYFIKKTVKSSKNQNSNPQMSDEIGNCSKVQQVTALRL